MKKNVLLLSLLLLTTLSFAQVGIGTTSPEGALDITSSNMGVVVPRVASIETAVDASGNEAVNGTILFDQSRNKICFRVSDKWICNGIDASGNATTEVISPLETENITYVKASNPDSQDNFGELVAMSDNGLYLVVSARREDSDATGINGDDSNNNLLSSGSVYVYFFDGTNWMQQAYVKASNGNFNDNFGESLSISNDGSRFAVGARFEDSNATGVNGDQTNNGASASGAVYIFSRSGTTWSQEAYVKASNTEAFDYFGTSVSISKDGTRLAVGAFGEGSNATGINGDETDNSLSNAGAVYLFSRTGTTWAQEAYIKASNTDGGDYFGASLCLDGTGTRLTVGAEREASNATGVNGNQSDNSMLQSGAVFVYTRSGTTWSQEAYIKASNTDIQDSFGASVSISNDGSTMAVGAMGEASNASGINGNQTDNSIYGAGAVYVFTRSGTTWSQEAYMKASNPNQADFLGYSIAISGNGSLIIAGAPNEDSDARGFNGDPSNNIKSNSGASYTFTESGGVWSQTNYLKASNSDSEDRFGDSCASNIDGTRLAVGSRGEDSNATGINGNQDDNSQNAPGAAYIIEN